MLINTSLEANRDLEPGLQRASVRATLPLLLPARGKPFGYQDPAAWGRFTTWMRDNRLIGSERAGRGALSNRFLPGSGL